MKRLIPLVLIGLLSGCGLLTGEKMVSPVRAGLHAVEQFEAGEEVARLRGEDLNEDSIFRSVEAVLPFAASMKIRIYKMGLYEVSLDVAAEAKQAHAAILAEGLAREAVRDAATDAEKFRALHDLLVRSCVYDVEAAEAAGELDGASAPFTAYGALVDGKAVCAGYARAYMLLCRAVGLDAIYVADETMNHSWNAVRLDGNTYFIDCTFDDPVPDRGDRVSHDYFLKDADTFAKTHTWDRAFYEQVMDEKWPV